MEKNYRAELTGLFGDPVDGNPTGVMEEAGFKKLDLNYRYITMKVLPDNLESAFAGAKALGFRGLNMTMPHKIKILPYLDELTKAAKIIGAVNTIYVQDGQWIGENTDGKGFIRSLQKEKIGLDNKTVTILGAGGAARAIAVECALAGAAKIYIINRSMEHGIALAELVAEKTAAESNYLPWQKKMEIPEETQILIQATSIGLHPNIEEKADIDYDTITADMVVSDVVFNPVETEFLKEAKVRGAKNVSGIGMLVEQGALNFSLWTGEAAPYEEMYRALEKEFEE